MDPEYADSVRLRHAEAALHQLKDCLLEASIHQERFQGLYIKARALLADLSAYHTTDVRDATFRDAITEIEQVCGRASEHILEWRRAGSIKTFFRGGELKAEVAKLEERLEWAARTFTVSKGLHEIFSELQRREEQREKGLSEITGTLPPSADLTSEVERIGGAPFDSGVTTDIWLGNWSGKQVALRAIKNIGFKKERAERARRLLREAEIWRGLQHAHVLSIYGTCYFSPFVYLVSPLSVNGNALKYLKLNPEGDRLRLLAGATSGLAYLHTHDPRVIHGDVRAANIQVMEDGEACISDFGLAQLEEVDVSITAVPEEGTEPWRWMAPERVVGETGTPSPATDVWSFGMAAFEIFTGRWPYDHSQTPFGVILDISNKFRHPRPRGSAENWGLSDEVWDMMCRCWHQDAVDRPEMSEVASFFEGLATRAGSSSHIGERPGGSA